MPKISYISHTFNAASLKKIAKANQILDEYAAQGFTLTLRQLYYQFVARALIANTQREYKNLGNLVNDARLAGLIDWYHLEDRTRNLAVLPHWDQPGGIVQSAAAQFRVDRWANQPVRIEVWIEKEALAGIFAGVCQRLDLPYFACRGYTSQSEMWTAAQRLIKYQKEHGTLDNPRPGRQRVVILHFGDHDPSGTDMTRDIIDRLKLFTGNKWKVRIDRLALNMAQIEQYNPPPQPAKTADSRHNGYAAKHGSQSWELDALEPSVLVGLVERAIEQLRDEKKWEADTAREKQGKRQLRHAATHWASITDFFGDIPDDDLEEEPQ
jgi:hypothetical protein